MFAIIIHTIIGAKFQTNPLTTTLFSGSGPKSRRWRNLKMQWVTGLKVMSILVKFWLILPRPLIN